MLFYNIQPYLYYFEHITLGRVIFALNAPLHLLGHIYLKFEISGKLWFWSGTSLSRRTPRLVFHVTVTPMSVSNLLFDTAIDDLEWKNPIYFGDSRKNQNGHGGHFVKI